MELIIILGFAILAVMSFILWYCVKIIDEIVKTRNLLLRSMSTTQSRIKLQRRQDPYPKVPKPKVEQRYEGQGVPRPLPGTEPRKVSASGTAVRIGKVAQRRVGGSPRNTEDS